ncbi:hypothetical protein CTEN210_13410 [Chaetoceros tenuissimus]|uniref:Uncharacterized protein n=1 Tax=Chaetoceros tenuissimus TaxID=426638 RepID=A0AAD3D393_9STRA|nr:hypothetical protein CTEN210_13410 [Chaetoceros tenuissimus]
MKFQSISFVLLYVTANSTAFQTSLQPLTQSRAPTPSFQRTSTSLAASKEFVNDGKFFFMQPFLQVLGFKEGTTTFYGPAKNLDPKDYPSTEEQMKLRQKASADMVNINQEERDRRIYAGNISYKISVAYAIFAGLFLQDPLSRFLIVLPLFFAVGYTKSGQEGL